LHYTGSYYRALIRGEAQGLRPSLERGLLWAASQPVGWLTTLRNRLYDRGWKRSHRVGVPVVSVGNLSLGGTGKTPCVEYVAAYYARRGRRVAILSRGYASAGGPNDEALVLSQNLPDVPHLQGPDRVELARHAEAELKAEVLVLDDGFQHRRLARDLDIVLIDATQPWQLRTLFPRSFLRESPDGLKRAGAVVLTRCDQVRETERGRLREVVAQSAGDVAVAQSSHEPVGWINCEGRELPREQWRGRPVAAFCGIGNPEAFRRTLTGLGFQVTAFREFPDHHAYTARDMDDLAAWAAKQAPESVVMTTQKDLVKLQLLRLAGRELWALRVRLGFQSGQDALDRKLEAAFA
jgi:tetraacyldisaccharide 4'-kinase